MMNIDSYKLATKDIEQKLANIDSDNRKKLFLELINDFTIYSNLDDAVFNETFHTSMNYYSNFTPPEYNFTKGIESSLSTDHGLDKNIDFMDLNWTVLAKYLSQENKYLAENSRLEPSVHTSLIVLYSLVIIFGVIGNFAIVLAFLTNKVMLTTRNIFIANLAISDILLCSFTMPLTLVDLLTKYWALGQNMEYLCKLIGTTQASCVFFSAFSIVLIAVDRYIFIVHPTATQITTVQAFCLSAVSLFLSTFLSSPLFFLTKLDVKKSLLTGETFSYCYESWEPEYSRLVYTCICFTIQYFIPSITVGIVYTKVCQCLNQQSHLLSSHRRTRQMERRKKTNRMLITVTIIFFLSWAPLNLFNIVFDIFEPFENTEEDTRMMLKIFAFCHLSAMTSVCSNPIMYGFLNENFKQSLSYLMSGCSCCGSIRNGRNNPNVQLRRLCWTSNKVNAPQVRFFKHRETEAKVDLNLNVEQHTMIVQTRSDLMLISPAADKKSLSNLSNCSIETDSRSMLSQRV